MRNGIRVPSLLVFAAFAAFGQAVGAVQQFEVASVKPGASSGAGPVMMRMGGDAGRVDYKNIVLRIVLARAYGAKAYQISGPSWLDTERYDITAKVPDGVSQDQIPAMLQNLLADRFKMAVHHENKEQQVYALIVGKNGPKLKKSANDNPPNFFGPDAPPPPGTSGTATVRAGPGPGLDAPPPPPPGTSGTATVRVGPGPGLGAAPPKGAMMVRMDGSGGHMEARTTMGGFCDMLSNMLDRPVVDKTGLEGNFDLSLDLSPDDMPGLRKFGPPAGGPGALSGPGGPGAETRALGAGGSAPESAPGGSIFSSVQQLGLKLETRKLPIDYIVVDNAEKVPTEN